MFGTLLALAGRAGRHPATPMGLLAAACAIALTVAATPLTARADLTVRGPGAGRPWPPGTDLMPCEFRDGLVLVKATLRSPSGRDTTGLLVVDTGAPDLCLAVGVWNALSIDSLEISWGYVRRIRRPLAALEMGTARVTHLMVGGVVVDSVLGRGVLGLFAPSLYQDRAIVIDYESRRLAVVNRRLTMVTVDTAAPPRGRQLGELARIRRSRASYGDILGPGAVALPFRLFQGGRILVNGCIVDPAYGWRSQPLSLLLDTGASSCVVFQDAMAERVRPPLRWPRQRDVPYRTVLGSFRGDATLLPELHLTDASAPVEQHHVATGVSSRSSLPDLRGAIPDPIHGLLGNTFLARFRLLLDYGNAVLWLEPRRMPSAERLTRYHVGVRLDRLWGEMRVVAVSPGTPAAQAGVKAGDVVVAIDHTPVGELEAPAAERLLQGEPGSQVVLVLRRENVERVHAFRRQSRP